MFAYDPLGRLVAFSPIATTAGPLVDTKVADSVLGKLKFNWAVPAPCHRNGGDRGGIRTRVRGVKSLCSTY